MTRDNFGMGNFAVLREESEELGIRFAVFRYGCEIYFDSAIGHDSFDECFGSTRAHAHGYRCLAGFEEIKKMHIRIILRCHDEEPRP